MKINLSFIVPVFNVEKFLAQCIESIIAQKNINKEILIIDDGSEDNSLNIAKMYERKFDFIRVISKKNEGISSARNLGIKHAKGEYICFIDSDDFYINNYFAEKLLKICYQHDLDIIRGFYKRFNDDKQEYYHFKLPKFTKYDVVLEGNEFLKYTIRERINEVVSVTGLYKKSVLIDNSITFPFGISYAEDQLFFLELLLKPQKLRIMQTKEIFYSYRSREGSCTKTPQIKHVNDILEVLNKEYNIISKCNHSYSIKKYGLKYCSSTFYQLTSIYGRLPVKEKKITRSFVPFKVKLLSTIFPYNIHQFLKNLLFSCAPKLVDIIYLVKFNIKKGSRQCE